MQGSPPSSAADRAPDGFASGSAELEHSHRPDAIAQRLDAPRRSSYLGDAVLGAVDGAVTTFAIVAGAEGAVLAPGVVVILGVANLLADGFSMAASNYQRAKTEVEHLQRVRRAEERHIDAVPDGEREEVRQIFARKGFAPPLLDEIVTVVTSDRRRWIDTMVSEEYGLPLDGPEPFASGLATFAAFCAAGAVPLLPYVLGGSIDAGTRFAISAAMTAACFFAIGAVKGRRLELRPVRSGAETLAIGGAAAALAWAAGAALRGVFGGA